MLIMIYDILWYLSLPCIVLLQCVNLGEFPMQKEVIDEIGETGGVGLSTERLCVSCAPAAWKVLAWDDSSSSV